MSTCEGRDRVGLARALTHPPVAAFVATRVPLWVASYLCLRWFPTHTILSWQADAFPGNDWLNGWVRWDAMWYESLVDSHAPWLPPQHSGANFFPFYAWAAWLASLPLRLVLRGDAAFYIGGLVLSHAAFLAGLIGVYRLAAIQADRGTAARTVWLIAFFPFSFFFSAVYSDALYFCLAVWCFVLARAGQWPGASACASAAAMTRVPGLALYPALAAEFLIAWRRRPTQDAFDARSFFGSAFILLGGPAVIAAYYGLRYGHPLAFIAARQAGWQRATGLAALTSDVRELTAGALLACGTVAECLKGWDLTRHLLGYWYLALVPASALLTWTARRVVGVGPTVWVMASLAMALANGLDGMGRFTAVLFPAFIGAALIVRRPAWVAVVCAAFTPFLLLFTAQFARWRPVL